MLRKLPASQMRHVSEMNHDEAPKLLLKSARLNVSSTNYQAQVFSHRCRTWISCPCNRSSRGVHREWRMLSEWLLEHLQRTSLVFVGEWSLQKSFGKWSSGLCYMKPIIRCDRSTGPGRRKRSFASGSTSCTADCASISILPQRRYHERYIPICCRECQ